MSCEKDKITIEEKLDINIEVLESLPTSIKVSITPSNPKTSYYSGIIKKQEIKNVTSIIKNDIDKLNREALSKGKTISEYLKEVLLTGVQEIEYKELEPSTEYYIFSYKLNEKGISDNNLIFEKTSTDDPLEIFNITVKDIEDNKASVNIIPIDNEINYYSECINEKQYNEIEDLNEYLLDKLNSTAQHYGVTVEEVLADNKKQGEHQYDYKFLYPESKYYIWTVEIDKKGNFLSKVYINEFLTTESQMGDFKIELSVNDITNHEAICTVIPSSDDYVYFYNVIPKEEYDRYESDEEFLTTFIGAIGSFVNNYLGAGKKTYNITQLEPATDYILISFGFDGTKNGTPLFKKEFRTENPTAPELLDFEFNLSETDENFTKVEIIPTDNTVSYFRHYITKKDYDDTYGKDLESFQKYTDLIIDEALEARPGFERKSILRSFIVRFKRTVKFKELTPDTEYYVFGAACEKEGKILVMPKLKLFKTLPEPTVSKATASSEIKYYFNGDEVVATEPDYTSASGQAVTYINTEISDDTVNWYVGTSFGDITNDSMTRKDLIKKLVEYGSKNNQPLIKLFPWNITFTISTIAQDKDGNFGPIHHKVVKFIKEEASPIDEYPGR